MKTRGVLIKSAVVAALGGFLFGFDTAVISGATEWLREVFELSSVGLVFTVASALIGTIVGAVAVSKPADIIGRRNTLIILAMLYLLSAVGSALAWSWVSFMIFRFLGGLAVGGTSVAAPMYIAEISPANLRGRLVAVTQFNIVFGILMAFVSNYIITSLNLGVVEWRWMFGVEAFPAAAFFGLLFLIPLSPRWLVAQNRSDEARQVLSLVGAEKPIDQEMRDIQASLHYEKEALREPFFCTKYIKPVMRPSRK